jgi:hypothetical protein
MNGLRNRNIILDLSWSWIQDKSDKFQDRFTIKYLSWIQDILIPGQKSILDQGCPESRTDFPRACPGSRMENQYCIQDVLNLGQKFESKNWWKWTKYENNVKIIKMNYPLLFRSLLPGGLCGFCIHICLEDMVCRIHYGDSDLKMLRQACLPSSNLI